MNTRPEPPREQALSQRFQLGALNVNPCAGEVSGPAGRRSLDPKVMAVLVVLTRHAGEVVSRADLISKLWPGVAVTDDALTRCIYVLRQQLSSAGGSNEYRSILETLPKRGYRLNSRVASLLAAAVRPSVTPRWRMPAIVGGIAAAIVILVEII
jgi:DNA-binding winged helix-turn-helix (wHTH) protein